MYEFIILLQLMQSPKHGYLIAKIINDIIGPYARLSPGRLYPLLAKMEQNGLIEIDGTAIEQQRSDRQLRTYKITEDGKMRFYALMRDTSSNPGDYQKLFTHKVSAFGFITPIERLNLIDHYIHYCQSHVFHHESEAKDLARNRHISSANLEFTLEVLRHSIDEWHHELAWARSLREKEFVVSEQTDKNESTLYRQENHS